MLAVLEVFLRGQAAKDVHTSRYREQFLSGSAPWVAFGDSHLEGSLLSSAVLDNLGQASDNLDTIIGKVTLRAARGGLAGVILPADPQIFSFYRVSAQQEDRISVLREDYSSSLMLFDPRYRPYLGRTFWSVLENPSILLPNEKDSELSSVHTEPQRPQDWMKTVTIRVQLHTPVSNFSQTEEAEAYRELIANLERQGIKVCMVRYPVSEDYLTVSNAIPAFEEARTFFADVADDYDIPLVDLSELLSGELYFDPDHIPGDRMGFVSDIVHERCGVTSPQ
jgi:hypothetical protein